VRALLVLLLAAVAAPAVAGTPPHKHTIVVVKHDSPKPVVITIDGSERVVNVKLTKLDTTPRPRCKTDRRGAVHCAITY
jgi:hypothetical protein